MLGARARSWRRHLALWSAGLLLATTVAAGKAPSPDRASGVWEGVEATDLEGRVWSRESLLGKVVLLDFWATWCAPCLEELPNLKRIHEQLGPDGVVVLGVSLDRAERSTLRSFVLRQEMSWPQIHDRRGLAGPLPRHFGVEVVPRTIVVDRSGRMVAVDLRGEALYVVLRDLSRPPR